MEAVNPLITKDNLAGAMRLPNLPRYVPALLEEPGKSESETGASLWGRIGATAGASRE